MCLPPLPALSYAELRTKMVHQKRRRNPLQCEGLPLWPRITLASRDSWKILRFQPTDLRFPHVSAFLDIKTVFKKSYITKRIQKGNLRYEQYECTKKTRTACTSVSRFRSKPKLQTTKVPPWMNSNKRAIWSWCCSDFADFFQALTTKMDCKQNLPLYQVVSFQRVSKWDWKCGVKSPHQYPSVPWPVHCHHGLLVSRGTTSGIIFGHREGIPEGTPEGIPEGILCTLLSEFENS